jgi:hypothetical protein
MSAQDNLGKQFNWPMTVSVPTKFLNDHLNRCDDCAKDPIKVIKKGKSLSTVELQPHHYNDLLSDADYYHSSEWDKDNEPEMVNLSKSAGSTKKRLLGKDN